MYALLGRDDFSELPEYTAPSGEASLQAGILRGANVAYVSGGELHIWDGEGTFDSSDPAVTTPPGVPPSSCALIGPRVRSTGDPLEVLVDCGGVYYRVGPEEITAVESTTFSGGEVPVGDVAHAFQRVGEHARDWVNGALWSVAPRREPPGLSRFDASTDEWVSVATTDPEAGPLLAMSSHPSGDGTEVWTVDDLGRVLFGRVEGDAAELAVVAQLTDFQALYGPDWFPSEVTLHALAEGVALVVHDRVRVTRVLAEGTLEPVEVPVGTRYPLPGVYEWGDALFLARPDGEAFEIHAEGPAKPVRWPEGSPRAAWVDGEITWLVIGGALARCVGDCELVEVGGSTRLEAIAPVGEGRTLLVGEGGIGLMPVPGADAPVVRRAPGEEVR